MESSPGLSTNATDSLWLLGRLACLMACLGCATARGHGLAPVAWRGNLSLPLPKRLCASPPAPAPLHPGALCPAPVSRATTHCLSAIRSHELRGCHHQDLGHLFPQRAVEGHSNNTPPEPKQHLCSTRVHRCVVELSKAPPPSTAPGTRYSLHLPTPRD